MALAISLSMAPWLHRVMLFTFLFLCQMGPQLVGQVLLACARMSCVILLWLRANKNTMA